jgi:phosphoglycerate dehydrogenase-like enzyme
LIGGKPVELNDFPHLKGIFKCGIGRDNIPEQQASLRGIKCGFPSATTASIIHEETASFASHLILKSQYLYVGSFHPWSKITRHSIAKKNLLIVGNGNIGSRVARKLNAFMNISTYDITNKQSELKDKIEAADCISIHLPLTSDTKEMFNEEKLSWMKTGASLINTARADIVNEDSLYNELKKGRIKAFFDVFWNEPYHGKLSKISEEFFHKSPHVASNCKEFLEGTAMDFRKFLYSFKL